MVTDTPSREPAWITAPSAPADEPSKEPCVDEAYDSSAENITFLLGAAPALSSESLSQANEPAGTKQCGALVARHVLKIESFRSFAAIYLCHIFGLSSVFHATKRHHVPRAEYLCLSMPIVFCRNGRQRAVLHENATHALWGGRWHGAQANGHAAPVHAGHRDQAHDHIPVVCGRGNRPRGVRL